MGAILPWGKKKTEDEIAADLDLERAEDEVVDAEVEPAPGTAIAIRKEPPRKSSTAVVPIKPKNDIVVHRGNTGAIVQVRSKEVAIAGVKRKVDPYQLIRMIKRVTQTIGEYKVCEDVYSAVIVGALRKARGDLVGILENEFRIHWQIDEDSGRSTFYM